MALGLSLVGLPGCGPGQAPGPAGKGRVSLSWTLDGATFDAARCAAERIDHMDVEVVGLADGGSVSYTEVQCDLNRFSLQETSEGRVVLRVAAIGVVSNVECTRYLGEVAATATTSFPQTPTPVPLRASRGCR